MKILIRGDFVYGFLEHAAKAIGIDLINAPRCDNPPEEAEKSKVEKAKRAEPFKVAILIE